MAESGDSVSIDLEWLLFGGKEVFAETSKGPISVYVCGDREKPALITYPDVALNCMSCYQGVLFCPNYDSALLQNFCTYNINPPGHELGAASISSKVPSPSVDDLADQVAEVLNFFGLKEVICMGVTAGAYILSLFAMKYRECVLGLILISPLCRAPSWTEWFYDKVIINLLYFCGMSDVVKEFLLHRYFSEEILDGIEDFGSGIVRACRKSLNERQGANVRRFLRAINQRYDLTEGLEKLQCKTLIFAGERSPYYSEAVHMNAKMETKNTIFFLVKDCGSLVTEEQPDIVLIAIELFLTRYGHALKQDHMQATSGPLPSSAKINEELLSLESIVIPFMLRLNWSNNKM